MFWVVWLVDSFVVFFAALPFNDWVIFFMSYFIEAKFLTDNVQVVVFEA